MRNTYRNKHLALIELITDYFGDAVEITGHSAGLHIQTTVKTSSTAKELLQLAEGKGVRVYDFRQMWMSREGTGYPNIYLGFGGISEGDMEAGILLLKEAWEDVLKK
ncbi:hypothetical protein [Mesobacillus zeae]|uniref:GntR family transcriptional regulator n=1 Tax=Mesobacillus zeae TaxID=1917180 RepID=A0A398B5U4_9BACI|nr:hypothetical protein [Mesobacillus zeae]RID84921.1 hypothetical protein D1970_11300 [Mesobacillus zeae]